MTFDDLMRTIRETSPRQWLRHDAEGVYTLRDDLDARIERRESPSGDDRFHEDWATKHPDPIARRREYAIFYGSSLAATFALVSVDGGRAELPPPSAGTRVIADEDYRLARIVGGDQLDEYIGRSGLTVEKSPI